MMEEKIVRAIETFNMIGDAPEITAAVSGGADSMALLYALKDLSLRYGFVLFAAHFNHKIRGAEAERDENFVKEQCKKLAVELFCGSADVPSHAKKQGISTELAARELRYDFLRRRAHGLIATAHTASDNIETVIFNLTRGTGLKGLCGIPEKREGFIRPMIFCSRDDVETYCKEKNIPYVTDSTNLCDDYSRNKIRHNVIPVLKQINPSLEETAGRTVLSLKEDCNCLEELAQEEFDRRFSGDSLSVIGFNSLKKAIAVRVLKIFCRIKISSPEDSFHLGELYRIACFGGKTSLPKNCSAFVSGGRLFIDKDRENIPDVHYRVKISETVNDLFKKDKKVNGLFLNNAIDCDKIVGKLEKRLRMPGDRIKLNSKSGTKTLKKLFTERKIPLCERNFLPILADDCGPVWIYGIGVAERCRVTAESKRIFIIDAGKV